MTAHPDRWEPYHPQPESELGPLFAVPIREMARRGNPATSQRAAIRIADKLTELQQRVYRAFQEHGPMSARTCENLPEFRREDGKPEFAPSTLRKRISELAAPHRGWLRDTGREDAGCAVYEVAPKGETSEKSA